MCRNPAVTAATMVTGHIGLFKGLGYIIVSLGPTWLLESVLCSPSTLARWKAPCPARLLGQMSGVVESTALPSLLKVLRGGTLTHARPGTHLWGPVVQAQLSGGIFGILLVVRTLGL